MKKSVFIFIIFFIAFGVGSTQLLSQVKGKEAIFKTLYYDMRRSAHKMEGMPKGAVVFFGNSITEQAWWETLFKTKNIVNRGITGDNTFGMADRLPEILESSPSKLFFMGGINDISLDIPVDTILSNIRYMVRLTKKMTPECKMYIQSVLPVNESRLAYAKVKGKNPVVRELNGKIKKMCEEEGVMFLDIASILSDENGNLKLSYTRDGLHIYPEAYRIWAAYLKKEGLLK